MLYGKAYVAKYREHNTSTYRVLLCTTFIPDADIVVYSTRMEDKVYSRNVFFFCSMALCKRLTLYIMPRGNMMRMTNMEGTGSKGISQCM